jgi:hypothetical protein
MQIENDYDKEVYNGDIEAIDLELSELTIAFDGLPIGKNNVRFSAIAAMVMVTSITRAMIVVAMVIRAIVIGLFRRGSTGRDRSRLDNMGNTAGIIFGIGLSRGGDRCPNRDEGCGGNDERLLHAASPESKLGSQVRRTVSLSHNGTRRNYHRSWAKVPCLIANSRRYKGKMIG